MKQSKRLTRAQREFLEKRNKDTENVRVLEDNNKVFRYIDKTGAERVLYK